MLKIIPESLKAVVSGAVLGSVASIALSLTLEPEISEIRMGQYGFFIGLISSSVCAAMSSAASSKDNKQKDNLQHNNTSRISDFNPVLVDIVRSATENHLNALVPGSSEYFEALELYGKLLSGENCPPPTNARK